MNKWNNEDGTIKWTKSDIARLKKAVNNFNAKRQRLINKEKELQKENRIITNTVDKESFTDIKNLTLTRKQLNEYIKSLRDFSNRGVENIDEKHFEKTGQKISVWQHKQIKRNIRVAKTRLLQELEPYKQVVEGSGGLSKIDMKNTEATAIINRIDNLYNYVNKEGYEFREKVKLLKKQGSYDYTLQKAIIYRDNYIEVMQKYKGRPGFEEFMKKLKSNEFMQNPQKFYEQIKNFEDVSDLYRQSNETLSQADFEELMKAWGVEFNEDYQEEINEEFEDTNNKKFKYSLISLEDGKIIAQSDSVTYLINLSLELNIKTRIIKNE